MCLLIISRFSFSFSVSFLYKARYAVLVSERTEQNDEYSVFLFFDGAVLTAAVDGGAVRVYHLKSCSLRVFFFCTDACVSTLVGLVPRLLRHAQQRRLLL